MTPDDERAIREIEWRLLRLKHQVELLISMLAFNLVLTFAALLLVLGTK
jgi:hypothetical protein